TSKRSLVALGPQWPCAERSVHGARGGRGLEVVGGQVYRPVCSVRGHAAARRSWAETRRVRSCVREAWRRRRRWALGYEARHPCFERQSGDGRESSRAIIDCLVLAEAREW